MTDINNATLTSLLIFQKTVEYSLPMFRWCLHVLASSDNTLVLVVQSNSTTLLLRLNLVTEMFLRRGDFKSSKERVQTDKRQI